MKRKSGDIGRRLVATLLIAATAARPGLSGEKDEAWLLQTNLLEKAATATARLPNALILGDSISLGYTPAVKKKLAGRANVSRPGCNCGPSQFYLRSMRGWVGTNHWDVIHVNFGIWDNHYLKGPSDGMGSLYWGREVTNALPPVAKGAAIRDLGFRIRTPIKEYERNLRTILEFLKSRADAVVFGLTTPLTGWEKDDRCGRIRVYNELAADVCKELGVAVDDLYAVAERHLDCQTDGCHFNAKGYDFLAEAVADSIRKSVGAPSPAPGKEEIAKLVAEDLAHEVRPGGVGGQPFWNANARFFMYPPAFDFPEDGEAVRYAFEIVDAKGRMTVLKAKSPKASLAPVWAKLPTGWTTVMCLAFDRLDRSVVKGTRAFWKQAPFTGDYPPAACGYGEFAAKAKGWLYAQPAFQKFLKTRDAASCGYWGMTYPSKMISAVIMALCSGSPSEQDLAAARAWADWLISVSEKPGRPLAYFTPTYYKTAEAYRGVSDEFAGQTMLIYPAAAGSAFLQLHGKTGEAKYLDWAKGIAETYLKLQGEDGSWFLKMYLDTGREVTPNRLMPLDVIAFLESLHAVTKDARYRTAADRAFASIDNGPVRTWCWEGQFEDVDPSAVNSYRNLTKYPACDAAIYVLKRYPGDGKRLALARELLRFAEDQFVCWERPFGDMPPSHNVQNVASWTVPGALEQYFWYMPIDASASKLIQTYLALYKAEGNPLDLAKAKALGDTMTRVQRKNGDVPTHWCFDKGCSWWNCLLSDVFAMNELEAACKGR